MSVINFTKCVASGNDFVVIDNRENKLSEKISDFSEFAKFSCKRRRSVGADGLLVLEDSKKGNFKMRIFNPDGSEVSMCGNGIRCSALYAFRENWCTPSMKIETKTGILQAEVKDESVKVKMTPPRDIKLDQSIGASKAIVNLHTIDTGVPHAIHFVENIEKYPVNEMGSKIRYHKHFEPEGTNADFVEIKDKSTILVRTYERGVENETLACGTGVVASCIISSAVKGINPPVSAVTKSGDILKVYFKKEHNNFAEVYFEGKAYLVFEGGLNYV